MYSLREFWDIGILTEIHLVLQKYNTLFHAASIDLHVAVENAWDTRILSHCKDLCPKILQKLDSISHGNLERESDGIGGFTPDDFDSVLCLFRELTVSASGGGEGGKGGGVYLGLLKSAAPTPSLKYDKLSYTLLYLPIRSENIGIICKSKYSPDKYVLYCDRIATV